MTTKEEMIKKVEELAKKGLIRIPPYPYGAPGDKIPVNVKGPWGAPGDKIDVKVKGPYGAPGDKIPVKEQKADD